MTLSSFVYIREFRKTVRMKMKYFISLSRTSHDVSLKRASYELLMTTSQSVLCSVFAKWVVF